MDRADWRRMQIPSLKIKSEYDDDKVYSVSLVSHY
jgi:hypothetical protein